MNEKRWMEMWMRGSRATKHASDERGSALIAALMIVSMLAMLGLSMLSAGLTGSKIANGQADEYRLTSAVESVGILSVEELWSAYLRAQGGAAGTIHTFRAYLTTAGIPDGGPGGPPVATEGTSIMATTGIPGTAANNPEFDNVNVNALNIVRRDDGDSTRLYVTVSASTNRGHGIVNPVLNRAIQLVYTVEPAPFEGFDYGILANNVNCVFCHTVIDSAERVYNGDASQYDSFHKVKVGTLESLMLRNDGRPAIGDWDADTRIAGSLYVRGHATNQNGIPIDNWSTHTARSCVFDSDGNLVQDGNGNLSSSQFHPAGDPPQAGENLYLDYPLEYSAMPDGKLPTQFPPPFPDDGGIDPATGHESTEGADNRHVDPNEFYAASQHAEGSIVAGTINVTDPDVVIDSPSGYNHAMFTGNQSSLASSTHGNVILTGTQANPIVLDGTVAIDGDVVIQGWVKGTGTILASGNIYVPTDLQYLDGHAYLPGDSPGSPTGPRTFGIAADGTRNVLGLAAGGNVLIGDYLRPSYSTSSTDIITGNPDGPWNFSLAEISLFNRTEWAHTQPMLPGPGEDHYDPSTWTVPNPSYLGADYLPRYYHFGAGDEIPIYNLGGIYFDQATGTWIGDAEVPVAWDPNMMTYVDPADHTNPVLYDPVTGAPRAAVIQVTPNGGWLSDEMQKMAIEYFESQRPPNTPMSIDGLLYTNNAIFGIVGRHDGARGQVQVNGSLVCADLGMLAPGYRNIGHNNDPSNVPGSPYAVGLRLNYDKRTKGMLHVTNPYSVTIKRTLWNPTANVL